MLGSLAEIYIERLRAETKRGKQARARKGLWNGSIPLGYCNGLCTGCTDVNGRDYCPHFGQANRSNGKTLVIHPIESVAVKLTYRWYETGFMSHRLIAVKLNAYKLVLPDGTTRRFRTKRYISQGGPQDFSPNAVREILSRIFYTGQVAYYGTNAQGHKLKRGNFTSLIRGQHPALVSQECFDRCQQVAHERVANIARGGMIRNYDPHAGACVNSFGS